MKKSISNLGKLMLLIVITALFSCEGPEGPVGPIGPTGATGPAGQTGQQGPAGQDGQDGQDGNANVTIVALLSENITWIEGEYLGRPANTFSLESDDVNADIVDHGTVLGYCKIGSEWFILPLTWEDVDGLGRQYIVHSYALNTINLYAFQTGGVLDPGGVEEYRFLLITDNTVPGAKGVSAEKDILAKLEKAGVDVTNYEEVVRYFGIE